MRPYSIRDLRSALHVHTLTYDFFGDYDAGTRRWRFTSPDLARDAQRFLDAMPPAIILHDPDASSHVDAIRERGGFSLVARAEPTARHRSDDEFLFKAEHGANRRGTATYLFATQEALFEATRFLFPRTRASTTTVSQALEELKTIGEGVFTRPIAEIAATLRDTQPSMRETQTVLARCAAARALGTPSAGELRDDRRAALDTAKVFCPEFTEIPTPRGGVLNGLVAARSAHHIAVQTEQDGRGVLLPRRGIAMPLAQQTLRERTVSTWEAIQIELADGVGRANQLRGERDIEIGALRLTARAVAAKHNLAAVVHEEDFSASEDLNATIVATTGELACAFDAGAYAVIGRRRDLNGDLGASLVTGPSLQRASALTHGRR